MLGPAGGDVGAIAALPEDPQEVAGLSVDAPGQGVAPAGGNVVGAGEPRPVADPVALVEDPELPGLAGVGAPRAVLRHLDGEAARAAVAARVRAGVRVGGGVLVHVGGAVVVRVGVLVRVQAEALAAGGEDPLLILHQVEAQPVPVEGVGADRGVVAAQSGQFPPLVQPPVGAQIALAGGEGPGVAEEDVHGVGEEEPHLLGPDAGRPVGLVVVALDRQVLGAPVVLTLASPEAVAHEEGVGEAGHEPLVEVDEVAVGHHLVGGVDDAVVVEVGGRGAGTGGARVVAGVVTPGAGVVAGVAGVVAVVVGVDVAIALLLELSAASDEGGQAEEGEEGEGVHGVSGT